MPLPLSKPPLSGCLSLARLCGTLAWTTLRQSWLVRRSSCTPSMSPLERGLASPSLTPAPQSSLSSCTRRSTRLGGCGPSQRARRLLQERRDSPRLQGAPRLRALRVRAPANRFPRLPCPISCFVYVISRLQVFFRYYFFVLVYYNNNSPVHVFRVASPVFRLVSTEQYGNG